MVVVLPHHVVTLIAMVNEQDVEPGCIVRTAGCLSEQSQRPRSRRHLGIALIHHLI
jgi:hypothetical protein